MEYIDTSVVLMWLEQCFDSAHTMVMHSNNNIQQIIYEVLNKKF